MAVKKLVSRGGSIHHRGSGHVQPRPAAVRGPRDERTDFFRRDLLSIAATEQVFGDHLLSVWYPAPARSGQNFTLDGATQPCAQPVSAFDVVFSGRWRGI